MAPCAGSLGEVQVLRGEVEDILPAMAAA